MVESISQLSRPERLTNTYVRTDFPEPAVDTEISKGECAIGLGVVRFPWIHKKELDSFQFLKTLL